MNGLRLIRAGLAVAAVGLAGLVAVAPALSSPIPPAMSSPTGTASPAATATAAAPVTIPASFAGVASASGLLAQVNLVPSPLPTYQTVYLSLALGNSTYSPAQLNAEAAPLYPGQAVIGLAGLLCEDNIPTCSIPPLAVVANADPNTPDATIHDVPSVTSGAPIDLGALSGEAEVGVDGVGSTAVVGGLNEGRLDETSSDVLASAGQRIATLLGHPLATGPLTDAVIQIGAITGTTTQSFTNGSTLVVQASARDSDVNLLGGLIHIGAVTSTSTTTTNGGKVKSHVDQSEVTGVMVAGIPATIGSNGITLSGTSVGASVLADVNSTLEKTLAALNLTIHLLGDVTGPSELNPDSCTDGEADGLQLTGIQNLKNVQHVEAVAYDDVDIAAACTTGFVGAPSILPGSPNGTSPGSTGSGSAAPGLSGSGNTGSGNGSSTATGFVGNGSSFPTGPVSTGVGTGANGTGPGIAGSPSGAGTGGGNGGGGKPGGTPFEADLGTALVTNRLTLLYVIFVLGGVAVLLGAIPLLATASPPTTVNHRPAAQEESPR